MFKIVILGANSYIARNLIFYLKHDYSEIKMQLYDIEEKQRDGFGDYFCLNVLNLDSLSKIDFDCDVIFVFVGKTGSAAGFDDYMSFLNINEVALLNILSEYRKQKSNAKIIFPSTRLVYKGRKGLLKEDDEKEFKTIYAINKFACEQYLEQYNRVFGVKYCIFRICVPYGTLVPNASSYGTAEFMISKAIKGENIQLYGDGSVRRSFIYIGDLCEALARGAFCMSCVNDVYNIGGEDRSLTEIAALVSKKYSVEVEYVEWPEKAYLIESGDTVFDDRKLQSLCPISYSVKFEKWCNE